MVFKQSETAKVIALANEILDVHGGYLFEGYSRTGPSLLTVKARK
jgi:hypothetical protein